MIVITNVVLVSCGILADFILVVTHTYLPMILFITHFDREEAVAAIRDGEVHLKMLQRQATISQLYPSARSVME